MIDKSSFNENLLITGGEGFIGKSLRKVLDLEGIKYYACPNSSQLNLCDFTQVKALPKASVILHFAAKTSIPESFNAPADFYYNNIISTLNILEKAKQDAAKVIFLSTYVYGIPTSLPVDESHVTQPLNPYTQSKVICEELCASYSRDFSIPVVVIRPFNIYGPGQASNFFIPTIFSQLKQRQIHLQNSKPKRDYVFINDLIDAIILLLKNNFKGYEIYNVGSGFSYSVKEVVNMILELSNSKADVHYTDIPRKGEVYDCRASIDKIYNAIGWKPKTTIRDGLLEIFKSYS